MRYPAFLVLLLASMSANAIELRSAGVKGGIGNVGTDMQFEGAANLDPDSEWVAVFGGFAQWRRNARARFEILTEAWWIRPGFSQFGELHQADILALPILLRSAIQQNDPELYVFFGPCLEFVVGTDEHPILDQYRSFAFAGQAGMGVEKRLSRHVHLLAEFRFSAEFSNLYDMPEGQALADMPAAYQNLESVTHRWLQFSLGVRF